MVETLPRHRFTLDAYHRMVETGILTEDDPVELIHGELVEMAPIGVRHAHCVDQLSDLFAPLRSEARLRVQNPVTLERGSEPEPDFVLARPRARRYGDRHPGASDVLLVVEVAETSQYMDREVKALLYAERGIPEYWIVDIPADAIEVYREPAGGVYGSKGLVRRGGSLSPAAFPDFEVRVDDLLP